MNLMPSWKTTGTIGIIGTIVAVLAYLFWDNPMIQGLLEFFTGGKAEAKEQQAAKTDASSGGNAGASAAGKTEAAKAETPAPQAAEAPDHKAQATQLMATWKQSLRAENAPEALQQFVAQKERELLPQIENVLASKLPPEKMKAALNEIQQGVTTEALQPEFEAFKKQALKQTKAKYDGMLSEISASQNVPEKERTAARTAIVAEKKAVLQQVEAGLDDLPVEKKAALALSPEAREAALKEHGGKLDARKTAVEGDIGKIAQQNSGLAWVGSGLGWASLGVGLAGLAAMPFTGGASGIPLIMAITSGTLGAGAGACKVANNMGKHGNTMELGLGIADIVLSAVPTAFAGKAAMGLWHQSGSAAAKGVGFFAKPGAFLSGASIAEGQAMTAVDGGVALFQSLNKGASLGATTEGAARGIMKQVASGEVAAKVVRGGTDIIGITLRTANGTVITHADEAGKIAGHALVALNNSDPLVGSTTNAVRLGGAVLGQGATKAGDYVMPLPTPAVKTLSSTEQKTTLSF